MIFTLLVYFILVLLLVSIGATMRTSYNKRKDNLVLLTWILLFLFCFIEGCRFQVGTDWENYYEMYEETKTYTFSAIIDSVGVMEPLYLFVNYFVSFFGAPHQVFFGLIAGLNIILFCKAFRRFPSYLVMGTFLYGISFLVTSQNIMRQTFSTCIFLFSINYLLESKYVKYVWGSLSAILIHYSSIISILGVIVKSNFFNFLDKRIIGVTFFAVSYLLGNTFISGIEYLLPAFIENEKYLTSLSNVDVVESYNTGLGAIFNGFTSLLLIYFSKEIVRFANIKKLELLFRLFLIGTVLSNAFANSMFLMRLPFMLVSLKLLLLPMLFSWFWHKGVMWQLFTCMILFIMTLAFIMGILSSAGGCSPFQFQF